MFSFPDVVANCDEPEYHDLHKLTVLNPTAMLEVLSQATDSLNRGENCER